MADKIKIGIIGGDRRILVLTKHLSNIYECAVWGFDKGSEMADTYLSGAVRCTEWDSAVNCSSAVILPLPTSRDGIHVNCPLSNSGDKVKIEDIIRMQKSGSLLLSGKIPPDMKLLAAELGISVYDYYDSEEVQIKNSVPTAEGAIKACIETLPITIHGMRAAVIGYGRVGRTLAQKLVLLGATVFAVARSTKDLSWAKCDGCIPVPLDSFRKNPVICDAIFNTVPAQTLEENTLCKINPDTVIFELADGGINTEITDKYQIRTIPLPALPGKTSPITSGEIIYSAVRDKLNNYFNGRNVK